ncbi:TcfC E-set like domain-containing protein [Salmonella enterica]
MKIPLLFLTLTPFIVSADDLQLATNVKGLPEDFKRYFYNSEITLQIYLNDDYIFDANVALKENGDVTLINYFNESEKVDPSVITLWSDVLRKGVTVGKCTAHCPSGLMAVEYRLDSSTLKLYTSTYETSQLTSDYITVPEDTASGLIISNDLSTSVTQAAKSWGMNSTLTSSLAGWSQRASFQSSGTQGAYNYSNSSLYALFTQKEMQGSFFRLGFFSPENDTGNVQTSGFGYDSVVGVMWGTSDALLMTTDSVSAWPIYVTGHNQSVAEVWRDGRLIHTQQLQPGVQVLDTRPLPVGIYNITIKILENGQLTDTQEEQIYKTQGWSDPNKRWRMNFWGGQRRAIETGYSHARQNNPYSVGGGIDFLAHPRAILGLSSTASQGEYQLRTQADLTLSQQDRLIAQYTLGNSNNLSQQLADIRYYHNFHAIGSASLYWKSSLMDSDGYRGSIRNYGETWGASFSSRLPYSSSLILNTQYSDSATHGSIATDVSLTTQARLIGRDVNFRFTAFDRPGFGDAKRDYGISFGASFALMPAAQHSLSFDTGIEQDQGYSSLNYQWQPKDNSHAIRTAGAGVSFSTADTVISGNGAVDTPWVSGDMYAQHSTTSNTNTGGANLSQVLVIGGGKMSSINGNESRGMESALIVDVDSDDKNAKILASGNMHEKRLHPGRNIIETGIWKKDDIQFSTTGGESVQIFPERQSVQMNRGSVQYMKIKTVKTFTLVGMLLNEHGHTIKNRYVKSDVSGGMINADGVLTLDNGIKNRTLTLTTGNNQPDLQCALPSDLDANKKVQFISAIQCLPVKIKGE